MRIIVIFFLLMLFAFIVAYSIALSPLDITPLYYDFFGNSLIAIGGIYLIVSIVLLFKEKRSKVKYEKEVAEFGVGISATHCNNYGRLFLIAGIVVFSIGVIMSVYFYGYSMTAPEVVGRKIPGCKQRIKGECLNKTISWIIGDTTP